MKKFIFSFILFFIPFFIFVIIAICMPPTPKQRLSYMHTYSIKDSILTHIESPRIVLIGGSNLAFGINSQLIKDSMNINVVNTGFSVNIGAKYMLDSYLEKIKKGDIVLLSLEYEHYSDDFIYGSEPLLRVVLDVEDISLYNRLKKQTNNIKKLNYKQFIKLQKYFPSYIFSKFNYKEYNTEIPQTAYRYDALNQYGDVISHWHDTTNKYKIPYVSFDTTHINKEFFNILEVFNKNVTTKGGQLYMIPPAIYDETFDSSETYIKRVFQLINEKDIRIIGDPYSYKIPLAYLYDSHYHLNKKGVDKRTQLLISDLKRTFDK